MHPTPDPHPPLDPSPSDRDAEITQDLPLIPGTPAAPDPGRSQRWRWARRAALIGVIVVALVAAVALGCGAPTAPPAGPVGSVPARPAPPIPAAPATNIASLPAATVGTVLSDAPHGPDSAPSGLVVHPRQPTPIYSAPGGRVIAALPTVQLGSPTWLPVITTTPGWVQVPLPTRPSGRTGWLAHQMAPLDLAHTPYEITLTRTPPRLSVTRDRTRIDTWPVALSLFAAGRVPAGLTFLLASVTDPDHHAPLALALGAHPTTPSHPERDGRAVTAIRDDLDHGGATGCGRPWVCAPVAALHQLAQVPLGTPVHIR